MTSGGSGKVRQGEGCSGVLACKSVAALEPPQTFTVWAQVWQALTPSLHGRETEARKGSGTKITQLVQAGQGPPFLWFLSSLHTQSFLWARWAGRTG